MNDPAPPSSRSELEADCLLGIATLMKRAGREVQSEIRGTSMGTTIPDGSQIRIRPSEAEALGVGQVVAFLAGQSLRAHRLVYKGKGERLGKYLLTLGDAWLYCDPPIHVSAALGVVTEYRHGGEWRVLTSQPGRSRTDQRKADLNVAFIRGCMWLNVGWAQWIAKTLAVMTGAPRAS
ncbi:MAG: S24/S26 family peptidase [Terriglobia bacterium]